MLEEAKEKYRKSEKGKEASKRYMTSPKGKEAKKKYLDSTKGQEAVLKAQTKKKATLKVFRDLEKALKEHPELTVEEVIKKYLEGENNA